MFTPRTLNLLWICLLGAVSSPAHADDATTCTQRQSESGSCSGLTSEERATVGESLEQWMSKPSSRLAQISGEIRVSIDGISAAKLKGGWAEEVSSVETDWLKIDQDPEKPTLFPLASVTKSFTAALVWKRIKEGLLRPQSRIADFVPFLADPRKYKTNKAAWDQITVGQLLNHTSGLADLVNHEPQWTQAYTQDWKVGEIIAFVQTLPIARQYAAMNHDQYSNSGYTILGKALESAQLNGGTERPLAEILRKEIFEPLEMRHTGVLESNNLDARVFALPKMGTDPLTREYLRVPPMFFAAGDLYSSAEDLEKWAVSLFYQRPEGFLGDFVTQLWSSPPTSPDRRTRGLSIGTVGEGKQLYHVVYKTGHLPSYANDLAYVPEYGITLIVLQNWETIGPVSNPDADAVAIAANGVLAHTVTLIRAAITRRTAPVLLEPGRKLAAAGES